MSEGDDGEIVYIRMLDIKYGDALSNLTMSKNYDITTVPRDGMIVKISVTAGVFESSVRNRHGFVNIVHGLTPSDRVLLRKSLMTSKQVLLPVDYGLYLSDLVHLNSLYEKYKNDTDKISAEFVACNSCKSRLHKQYLYGVCPLCDGVLKLVSAKNYHSSLISYKNSAAYRDKDTGSLNALIVDSKHLLEDIDRWT